MARKLRRRQPPATVPRLPGRHGLDGRYHGAPARRSPAARYNVACVPTFAPPRARTALTTDALRSNPVAALGSLAWGCQVVFGPEHVIEFE